MADSIKTSAQENKARHEAMLGALREVAQDQVQVLQESFKEQEVCDRPEASHFFFESLCFRTFPVCVSPCVSVVLSPPFPLALLYHVMSVSPHTFDAFRLVHMFEYL